MATSPAAVSCLPTLAIFPEPSCQVTVGKLTSSAKADRALERGLILKAQIGEFIKINIL
jgi:hypothetical protein